MNSVTMAKLSLLLMAVILFALSMRSNNDALRYAAIGFLAAAVLLRFVRRDRNGRQ